MLEENFIQRGREWGERAVFLVEDLKMLQSGVSLEGGVWILGVYGYS